MAIYIILSRFSLGAFDDPKHFVKLAEQVSKKIKRIARMLNGREAMRP
jgi:hypothetical protein